MNKKSRMKLIDAGFKIYRLDECTKVIALLSKKGGWSRVGSFTTKAALHRAFKLLMQNPKAIDG